MEERKNFLVRLRSLFGDCSRQSFLQKLRNWFNGDAVHHGDKEEDSPPAEDLPTPPLKILDINGTDAWRNHVEHLKDLSLPSDCIFKFRNLLENSNMTAFVKTVNNSLNDIQNYVDKHFKEPMDINEDTSEYVAQQTGKFVKEYVWDLLRGCHSGIKHSQGTEKEFYKSCFDALEKYLSSIGVYRKNITEGMDVRSNAKWFETPFIRESLVQGCVGKIDEIEVAPHFIPYRDDDGGQDEFILKGVCIAFGGAKKIEGA